MDRERKARLDSIFEAFSIMAEGRYVYVCDMREDYSRWSRSAVDYFDLPSEYMTGAGDIWAQRIHPDDLPAYQKSIDGIFAGTDGSHDMQYRARDREGNYAVCTCRGVVLRDGVGTPIYFCGAIQNHGAMSYVDTVTGLRSLYGFFDDLKAMYWAHAPGTVLLLGLSGFSTVNDLYGYSFGNDVLRVLGNYLTQTFAGRGSVYRMDGTKYAVISHSLDAAGMQAVYRQLQLDVRHRFSVGEESVGLTLNAGLVVADTFDISTETIYTCLKYAYSRSKTQLHGHCVVFTDDVTVESRHYLDLLNRIRADVTQDCRGFYLCYQPIVDAQTDRLTGMEALLRWRDERGTVPPDRFVPVLEQDAVFPVLGNWILRRAMTDTRRLLDRWPDLVVNVNLSYTQVEHSGFVDEVLDLLEETGLPPQNLCLELTERCKMLDMALLKTAFRTFRRCGIRIAVDDFGTGFSSLGILRDLPVTCIKVDREYVKNVETSSRDRKTVKWIAELASEFHMEVCVEGVETAEMRDLLRQYHVARFQGYLYSRPIPFEQFWEKYHEA